MTSLERDTRQDIVDVAERFFRQIGYQKTTVADIAKSLRMSPANVYRFFDSKKAINEAVAERSMAELEALVTAIAAEKRPAAERLREILTTTCRLNSARYLDNQRLHEMVACAMEESWDVIRAHVERYDAILRGVVADGMAKGEFTPGDARIATYCVRAAMIRFCNPLLLTQCGALPGPDVDEMVDFVLAGLGHRAPAV
ncbi:TetR family transcriptional regulator [Bosea sp. WAO]|uniref:TetR/AcrR family transcriptional regulator n=1 Tax=Bosea sp. WAO TaxID=406341 RepID=UPI000748CCDE|nr:TetR/AcrR family transcriptional regulator [Bosea sp. WAO]KUL95065.1 TetR family transcriptional regulator [Bosea sp. WAO]